MNRDHDPSDNAAAHEAQAVRERYARRGNKPDNRYSYFNPEVLLSAQERERIFVRALLKAGMQPVEHKKVLEIGCGSGGGLMQFMKLGFRPENLAGVELLEERIAAARNLLPLSVRLFGGDACKFDLGEGKFDLVFQSTVFSSILDLVVQRSLAARMWNLLKPGGSVLWYDFIYDNPRNPDVAGIPIRRVRELFPRGELQFWRVTLAPPISRKVVRIHPALYCFFNAFPMLRTHVVCLIQKPYAR